MDNNQKKKRFYGGSKKKRDPNAPRASNFFITINPHVPKLGSSDYTEETLRKKLREAALLFSDIRFQKRITFFATKDKTHTFETHTTPAIYNCGSMRGVQNHVFAAK